MKNRYRISQLLNPSSVLNQIGFRHLFFAAFVCLSVGSSIIAAVRLDGSFAPRLSKGGLVATVALQPDGKILIGGSFTAVNGFALRNLARLNADGSLDASFNIGSGTSPTASGGISESSVSQIIVQPDGKILVFGGFSGIGTTARANAARLNGDGSVDQSFNPAQISSSIQRAVLQPDEKIIIGGAFETVAGISRRYLARLNANGTLDTDFNVGSGTDYGLYALALQADGKVLIGGGITVYNGAAIRGVARLNPDGSLDSTLPAVTRFGTIRDIEIQPDGKILIGGDFTAQSGAVSRQNLARLNTDATLDASFSNVPPIAASTSLRCLTVQPDGKVLVGGSFFVNSARTELLRLNADGTTDANFTIGAFEPANSDVVEATVQADGKIIAAGTFTKFNDTPRVSILRLQPGGGLDTAFAAATEGTSDGTDASVRAVKVQPDGKVLVGGDFISINGTSRQNIARLDATGAIDSSFGTSGAGTDGSVEAIALQSDGKILIAGGFSRVNGMPRRRVARLNADGTLDASFVSVVTPGDTINDIEIQPDGKILLTGGVFSVGAYSSRGIVRLNADGSLDTSYAASTIDIATGYDVAVQADGKILVAGQIFLGSSQMLIIRFNANGTLDPAFTSVAYGGGAARSVALQPDGKILVGGFFSSLNGAARQRIARLNADGSLDQSFTGNATGFGGVEVVRLQPDGKVLIGGGFTSVNNVARQQLARLNADGSLDAAFNPVTAVEGLILALDLQADGAVIIGGSFSQINGVARTALARFSTGNVPFDFDGDGTSDYGVFRPNSGTWYLLNSQSGFTAAQFGASTDKLVPADFDGDGKTDLAVYRAGVWYVQRSSLGFTGIQFGTAEDIPVPADFDGDGRAEIAVFRPSNGVWYQMNLTTNQFTAIPFGQSGDRPVPTDFDGDGKTDQAVYRGGVWYLNRSTAGFTGIQFGVSTDKPVPADYDGDGKTDLAVARQANGATVWYVTGSTQGFSAAQFGIETDRLVPGDYDGDGKTDLAVWRSSAGAFYALKSGGQFSAVQFGQGGDAPVAAAFVP